jgi:hypothetical protein
LDGLDRGLSGFDRIVAEVLDALATVESEYRHRLATSRSSDEICDATLELSTTLLCGRNTEIDEQDRVKGDDAVRLEQTKLRRARVENDSVLENTKRSAPQIRYGELAIPNFDDGDDVARLGRRCDHFGDVEALGQSTALKENQQKPTYHDAD